MIRLLALFFGGFIQVVLIAANTWQIAHRRWVGAGIVGFLISLVWTFNVNGIHATGALERITYATGAMCGTVSGMLITLVVYRERRHPPKSKAP